MTLKSRLSFFTVFWLIFILILYNVFVYYFMINVATRSELQLLENKVSLVEDSLRKHGMQNLKDAKLLSDMYDSSEIIRIVNKQDKMINSVGTDKDLFSIKSDSPEKFKSETLLVNGQRVLYLTKPLFDKEQHIANLQTARRLTNLDKYLQVLLVALTVTSGGAIVFAIFGTYWFTSRLMGPISQMVDTMREIDRSGKLHRVQLEGREESVELQQMVYAFNQMIDRLERTMESQKHFVADASHELKTPLTVISSYADILKRWGHNNVEVRQEAIEAIANETERMQHLIRSMLTLAEAERDSWLNMTRFDIVLIVRELSEVLGITFNRNIRVHVDAQTITMDGDKEKIRQLLLILIDNARKYSKEPIDVRIQIIKHKIKLEVTDYGIGIETGEIDNMFQRFYRVDEARQRTTGGSGLGLSIAKKIIDSHDGTVEVFSKLNHGTTISILLPRRASVRTRSLDRQT